MRSSLKPEGIQTMCSSLRLAFALVLLSIVFPFARGQDQKPGPRVGGSIAQPANDRNIGLDDDKTDKTKNENRKVADAAPGANGPSKANSSVGDPLVRMLVKKGILTAAEGLSINAWGTPLEQRDRLAALLRDKGLISPAEFDAVRTAPSAENRVSASVAAAEKPAPSELSKSAAVQPKASPPPFNAAFAPVRLLPIDPPKRECLTPYIKLCSGARLKLYGFFKTSIIHDSSSPQGNDFPLPLLAGDTGPNGSPGFHLRARGLRLGANFEWLDPAPKMTLTGKIEFDFEGNFTRVNNRNISSIRSSQPSIRLAWVRIDRKFNDKTSAFALFGQDYTPFVSSTQPNTVENTNFGGLGYGAAYTRLPQARFGFNFKLGGSRGLQFGPEIAVVVPA